MMNDCLKLAGREGAGKDGKAERRSMHEIDRQPMKHVTKRGCEPLTRFCPTVLTRFCPMLFASEKWRSFIYFAKVFCASELMDDRKFCRRLFHQHDQNRYDKCLS